MNKGLTVYFLLESHVICLYLQVSSPISDAVLRDNISQIHLITKTTTVNKDSWCSSTGDFWKALQIWELKSPWHIMYINLWVWVKTHYFLKSNTLCIFNSCRFCKGFVICHTCKYKYTFIIYFQYRYNQWSNKKLDSISGNLKIDDDQSSTGISEKIISTNKTTWFLYCGGYNNCNILQIRLSLS